MKKTWLMVKMKWNIQSLNGNTEHRMTRLKMKRKALMLSSAKRWQLADHLSLQPIHSMGLRPHKWTAWHWKRFKNIVRHGKWRILGSWLENHDEPGPGKHDFLISVSSYSKKQQILHFLAKYLIQCKKAPSSKRSKMCGNALFLKLQKLKEDHVRQGHYYLEYLKFACEPNCESCKQEVWSAGVPGNWFPVTGLSETGNIPSTSDQIDQYLPSIHSSKAIVCLWQTNFKR